MTRTRDLHHISLETGDSAMIPSSHVRSGTRRALSPLLRDLAEHGEAAVPDMNGWRCVALGGGASRRCASFVIQTRVGGRWEGWAHVLWLGIATQSRCAARLWERMHREAGGGPWLGAATDPEHRPRTPWLATRMLDGVVVAGDPGWLQEFARCLAWCWIEVRVDGAAKEGVG